MRIALIGSSQYVRKFNEVEDRLVAAGHEVRTPAFDSHEGLNELGVCEHNRDMIEWAEEVHVIWDQRSSGTVFDFGMCFALRKPLVIEYMEPKTLRGVMERYAAKWAAAADAAKEVAGGNDAYASARRD